MDRIENDRLSGYRYTKLLCEVFETEKVGKTRISFVERSLSVEGGENGRETNPRSMQIQTRKHRENGAQTV